MKVEEAPYICLPTSLSKSLSLTLYFTDGETEAQERKGLTQIHQVGQKLKQNWNPGPLAPMRERQRGGQEGNGGCLPASEPLWQPVTWLWPRG